jgi:hypothetical protein
VDLGGEPHAGAPGRSSGLSLPFPTDGVQPGPSAGPLSKDKDKDKDKALPSFWIPSLTPEAKATKLEKPVSSRRGPVPQRLPGPFPP